jgi:predicted Ser/Thr protein kinase
VKLGRYEIVRELGKGAMGIVYLAKDPLIGRLVALKTIRPAAHGDDDEGHEFQQRFIREAQAAGILAHPAIVTVFDIGQDDSTGMSFIAMEYVEGQNLKEVLAQGRPLTFDQIGDIVAQIADALDFAHAKGIVHRDVKPANIILLDGFRAKIMDFGIAKIASGAVNLTTTGQFLGTPNYMAPEQIKGAPVDGRTDIFALGICLYECLTRRKPFGGDSLTSISYKIVHEPFPPLREINPQIPDGFEDIAARCLAKDPTKRYQRAHDLGNALRAVARGESPIVAEPMQVEETIVTRDRDRLPTVEVPFPEAVEAEETPAGVQTRAAAAAAAAGAAGPPDAAARPAPRPRPRIAQQFQKTLNGVRAMPLWRRPVPAVLFFGIVAVLVIALLAAVGSIQRQKVPARAIDTKAEAQRAREREVRNQANALVRDGRVHEAYGKYQELARLAPKSPAIAQILQKLSAIRQQEEVGRQQLALAKQKFNEGLALFNQNKYEDSIPLFEESFHLNPNSDEATNYLKLAQRGQQISEQERAARVASTPAAGRVGTDTAARTSTTPRTTTAASRPGANVAPAQLTTVFNSTVADGYIMVKAGGQILAHENLWEETGRFFKRKNPRNVSVTKELTPANVDVDIWVVIPSMSIQEHKVIRQNFQPGSTKKLVVSFDPQSKKFEYQLN